MSKVLIRKMRGEDLREVLNIEKLSNTIFDEFVGNYIIREECWTRQDFLDAANDKTNHCFVAEMLLKADPHRDVSWIYGSLIVSAQDGFWGTEHMSISPYAYKEIREAFTLHLIKLTNDEKYPRIYLTVRDDNYEELGFWTCKGFKPKLLRGKFGEQDGWLLRFGSMKPIPANEVELTY